jgi:hypothetical protein
VLFDTIVGLLRQRLSSQLDKRTGKNTRYGMDDDFYCHQPLWQELLDQHLNFILVCRPESHTTLYEHLEGIDLPTVTTKRWTGKVEETYTYRYLNGVPLRDSNDALSVNWCEVTVSRPDRKVTYKNSFATNCPLSDENVADIVLAAYPLEGRKLE